MKKTHCPHFFSILLAMGFLAVGPAVSWNGLWAEEAAALPAPAEKIRVVVDCDRGDSLQSAFNRRTAQTLRVWVSGTCNENVVITRDDVELRALDGAALVGQLMVRGAARVEVIGLTIRDTPSPQAPFDRSGDGLRVVSSRDVIFRDLKLRDIGGVLGISVEGGDVEFWDTSVLRTAGIGFAASNNGAAKIGGSFELRDSGSNGFCILDGGYLLMLPGAEVESTGNAFGLIVEELGTVTVSPNVRLVTSENVADGILVLGKGSFNFNSSEIESCDNGRFGFNVLSDGHVRVSAGGFQPQVMVCNNVIGGIVVLRDSVATFPAGTVTTGNVGPGLLIDESTVVLSGIVSRDNNGGDAFFLFGSRVTFSDPASEFGTPPFCDDSALVRGFTCGSAAGENGNSPVVRPALSFDPATFDPWQGVPESAWRGLQALRSGR